MGRPDLFRYLDYRRWLEDYLLYLKKEKDVLSKQITLKANFKSSSYLSMLIKGTRNLSEETFASLCLALDIEKEEKVFLWQLVEFSQATDMEKKDVAYQKIISQLKARKVESPSSDHYSFFSDWHLIAAFEGLGTSWRRWPLERQSESLGIGVSEMENILSTLKGLGLIEMRGKEWVRRDVVLQTQEETHSLFIRNFHRGMLEKAGQSLDRLSPEKRFFSGLTLPLNQKSFKKLIKEATAFQKSVNLNYGDGEKSEMVAQFNLQIFPLVDFNSEP